jgi:predicted enzyme related to lactoylglutathione lyase
MHAESVTHFEIFADDPAPLAEFYRGLFGWKIEKAPGVDYFMIHDTTGGAPGISGGLTVRPIPEPRSWVHYVPVESVDNSLVRVGMSRCKAAVDCYNAGATHLHVHVRDPQTGQLSDSNIWR